MQEARSISPILIDVPVEISSELSGNGTQVCDIAWWSESTLVRSFVSGYITLSPIVDDGQGRARLSASNLLGKQPEWFHGTPRISSCFGTFSASHSLARTFFVLECEPMFRRRRKVVWRCFVLCSVVHWSFSIVLQVWSEIAEDSESIDEQYDIVYASRVFRLLSVRQVTPQVL